MLSANILRTGTRHLSCLSRHLQGREAGGCHRWVCSIAETASLCLPTAPQNLRVPVRFLLQLNHNFSGGIRSSTWSTYIQRPSKPCNSYRIYESMFPLALQAEYGADLARVLCKSDSSLLSLGGTPCASCLRLVRWQPRYLLGLAPYRGSYIQIYVHFKVKSYVQVMNP